MSLIELAFWALTSLTPISHETLTMSAILNNLDGKDQSEKMAETDPQFSKRERLKSLL